MIKIYRVPQEEELSDLYKVFIEGGSVPVRRARVSAVPYNTSWPGRQRPQDQTEEAAFISIAVDCRTDIYVVPASLSENGMNGRVPDIVARPLSKGASAVPYEDGVLLTIPGPGFYTLEIGGFHNCLHIFADDASEDRTPADGAPKAAYCFANGCFDAGEIDLKSGETLYIDETAVVFATVNVKNADNVTIRGRGVLDNSRAVRDTGACLPYGAIRVTNSRNVTVEGITIRDSSCWNITVRSCADVQVRGVKIIGSWRYNTDGIDVVNSRRCTIRNSFLRTFDDVIALKGLKGSDDADVLDVRVSGCVLWCDWGRCLEIGAETCADEYRGIVFEDCDLIHGDCILMDLQNGDRASVHDVVFRDIRCEYNSRQLRPVYQSDMEKPYDGGPGLFFPVLFKAHLYRGLWSDDMLFGENYDVLLENISVLTDEGAAGVVPEVVLEGADEDHWTKGVTFKNLTINGEKAGAERLALTVGKFAERPAVI